MEAYCMKCRKKVEIKNPQKVTMKKSGNKRKIKCGVSLICGFDRE